jgi:hypothetical protein
MCKHNWEVALDKVLPSAYEQLTKAESWEMTGLNRGFFRKKSVTILKWLVCGKLDKTIEENP